ncbi:hypothetical protein PFTANZ_02064 [Plasmodium falciparum Tanzania (2000708)]|uniref:Uncharacterized protein n=1 Tax=Plasmodium falciparum Tanzania (2000708) TaxID=1036725 RepID=A0A024W9I6_PLAFA|nr:hypothetical protein PFTANZ_02064 [Plasmodium falciparum Tanzania (2000708)]
MNKHKEELEYDKNNNTFKENHSFDKKLFMSNDNHYYDDKENFHNNIKNKRRCVSLNNINEPKIYNPLFITNDFRLKICYSNNFMDYTKIYNNNNDDDNDNDNDIFIKKTDSEIIKSSSFFQDDKNKKLHNNNNNYLNIDTNIIKSLPTYEMNKAQENCNIPILYNDVVEGNENYRNEFLFPKDEKNRYYSSYMKQTHVHNKLHDDNNKYVHTMPLLNHEEKYIINDFTKKEKNKSNCITYQQENKEKKKKEKIINCNNIKIYENIKNDSKDIDMEVKYTEGKNNPDHAEYIYFNNHNINHHSNSKKDVPILSISNYKEKYTCANKYLCLQKSNISFNELNDEKKKIKNIKNNIVNNKEEQNNIINDYIKNESHNINNMNLKKKKQLLYKKNVINRNKSCNSKYVTKNKLIYNQKKNMDPHRTINRKCSCTNIIKENIMKQKDKDCVKKMKDRSMQHTLSNICVHTNEKYKNRKKNNLFMDKIKKKKLKSKNDDIIKLWIAHKRNELIIPYHEKCITNCYTREIIKNKEIKNEHIDRNNKEEREK